MLKRTQGEKWYVGVSHLILSQVQKCVHILYIVSDCLATLLLTHNTKHLPCYLFQSSSACTSRSGPDQSKNILLHRFDESARPCPLLSSWPVLNAFSCLWSILLPWALLLLLRLLLLMILKDKGTFVFWMSAFHLRCGAPGWRGRRMNEPAAARRDVNGTRSVRGNRKILSVRTKVQRVCVTCIIVTRCFGHIEAATVSSRQTFLLAIFVLISRCKCTCLNVDTITVVRILGHEGATRCCLPHLFETVCNSSEQEWPAWNHLKIQTIEEKYSHNISRA